MVAQRSKKLRQFMRFVSIGLIQAFVLSQSSVNYAAVPDKLNFNEKFGHVRESYKGSSEKMIIHIQDAHCVYEAQKNIIGLVRELYKNHNVKLVAVEGADSYFNADPLSSFPIQSVKQDVADYFLNKGRISGIEYLLIQNDLPVAVRGAENKDLYIENYNSFMKSMPKPDDKSMALVDDIDNAFESLKTKMLNKDLAAIENKDREQSAGSLAFVDYASAVINMAKEKNISFGEYKNIGSLVKAQEVESKIDFAKINVELSGLIDTLSAKIDKEQLTQLLNKNLFYKIGKIQPNEFYEYLQGVCKENSFDLSQYSNLNKYMDYLTLYKSIDDVAIADEVANLKKSIKEVLYENPRQKELIDLSHDLSVFKKLIGLKVSKREFKYYQANKNLFTEQRFLAFLRQNLPSYQIPFNFGRDYSILTSRLPMIDQFYKVALKRNEALIENTLSEMDLEDSNIAILITGGFHTQGITDLMKEQGISYKVISPSITEQPATSPYLTRMVGAPTEVEELLSSNRLQIPLVLADPSLIPDAAKTTDFLNAFKSMMESHPQSAEFEKALAENPTGYQPTLQFVDAFSIGDNKYVSFSLAGKIFNMVFVAGEVNKIRGNIINSAEGQPQISKIGNYSFTFIDEGTFSSFATQVREQGGTIDARTGLDSRIETALLNGKTGGVELNPDDKLDKLLADNFLVREPEANVEDDDGVNKVIRPTLAYMMQSKVSALLIQPKVAVVTGFDRATQEVLKQNGVNRVEVFSNHVDFSSQDGKELQQKLSSLFTNNKLELASGKKVFATVTNGVAQIYSITPQGDLKLKPQLVIPDSVFNAMLPEAPQVKVLNASDKAITRRGGIEVDAANNRIYLYELNASGQIAIVGNPVHVKPGMTSVDFYKAVSDLRKLAAAENIGFMGYSGLGLPVSFDNYNDLLQSLETNPLSEAFKDVNRFLSVAPSLKDLDLSGINNTQQLIDYFKKYSDGTPEGYITCCAAAAAWALDKMPVNFNDKAFQLTAENALQYLPQLMEFVENRIKGPRTDQSYNSKGQPEYSLSTIAQASRVFGIATVPVSIDRNNLENLLNALLPNEAVVLRVDLDGLGHYISVVKDVDGLSVYDIASDMSYFDLVSAPKMGISDFLSVYGESFTGQALVRPNIDSLNVSERLTKANVAFKQMDMKEQLETLAACGVGSTSSLALTAQIGSILEGRGFDNYGRGIKVAFSMDDLAKFGVNLQVVKNAITATDAAEGIDTDWAINITKAADGKEYLIIQASSRGVGPATRSEEVINRDLNAKLNVMLKNLLANAIQANNITFNIDVATDSYTISYVDQDTSSKIDINPASLEVLQHTRYKTKGGDRPANAHHETYKLFDERLDQPISISLGFNGDFEAYMMFKNILKNKYGEQFLATSDTEVISHLLARLTITQNPDGTFSPVAGQTAIMRFFRLADTIEAMLNVADVLRNKTYSPAFINALNDRLRSLGINPDQLLESHDGNLQYDSVKYPKIAVDLIYNAIDKPWMLDNAVIAKEGFFGQNNFFSIAEIIRNEFSVKRAAELALADYISIEDGIDGLLNWMVGDKLPNEILSKSPADQAKALEAVRKYLTDKFPSSISNQLFNWANELVAAKSSTPANEWDAKKKEMMDGFKLFATSSEKAANYVTSTGKVSVMAFNYATGHDLNRLIGARFGPKSTDVYLGIGSDKDGFGSIALSSEPRAFGPIFGREKERAVVIENVLALARGEIDLLVGGNYNIFYVDEIEVKGKNPTELAKLVHKIDAITGEDTFAQAKVSDTSWNVILDPEEAAKMSAFETEASVQGTTIKWTLEGLTKKNEQTGLYELNLGLNEDKLKSLINIMTVVGGGSGTSLNALSLAMEEARRAGFQFMDLALDADIIKASVPLITKGQYTISLVVSQSGTTGVAIQNSKDALNNGSNVLGLTNRRGSTVDGLSQSSMGTVITRSIDERAVAATGSNTNQIVALRLLGLYMAQLKDPQKYNAQFIDQQIKAMFDLSDQMRATVKMARDEQGDFKAAADKLIDYIHKFGTEFSDAYSSLTNANIRIGGIGLTRIADEYETKMTEMVRTIIAAKPADVLAANSITEEIVLPKPDVNAKISTVEAMVNAYLGQDKTNINTADIKLSESDIKDLKSVVVLGGAKHTHTLEHLENNYMPRHNIPVSKRYYNNDIAGITNTSLVIALAPSNDFESSVIQNIISTGAKVVVVGPQAISGAGYLKTLGSDAVVSEFLGGDILMQHISAVLGARDFQTADQVKSAVESLRVQVDGMRKLAQEFGQAGTNNRINMERYLSEIRKPGRGWTRLSQMSVGKVNQLSSAAYHANRFEQATGNEQLFKELATMKHGYYAPLAPGSMVTLFIPRRGTPGYDNGVKGIEEMLTRVNYPYAPFLKDKSLPIGILVAITAENPDDPMIKLLTDEEYAQLEQNTRDGKEDLIKRPNIVFQTPHGGVLEDFLLSDLVSYELNQAYKQDKQNNLNGADLSRGNIYINIEFPETSENKARLAIEREKVAQFKKDFPNGFVLTIAPNEVQGVEAYSDAVIRIPAADSTLALAVNHFLSLELTKARFMPLLQDLKNLSDYLKQTPKMGDMTPYDLLAGYAKGSVTDAKMLDILAGTPYADTTDSRYYKNMFAYMFTEGNIDPILSMAAAGVSVDNALIFTVDLIKGLAKVVTNDNRYTTAERNQLAQSLITLGLTSEQFDNLIGQGPFTLVAPNETERHISAKPEGIIRLAATIRGITEEQLVNESLYHELLHSALDIYPQVEPGKDIVEIIYNQFVGDQPDSAFMAAFIKFMEEYYREAMPEVGFRSGERVLPDEIRNMPKDILKGFINEAIVKAFTSKLMPSISSVFFKTRTGLVLTQKLSEIVLKEMPGVYSIINPVVPEIRANTPEEIKDLAEKNIARIVSSLNDNISRANKPELAKMVPDVKNIDTDPEQELFVNGLVNAELMAAIKALNNQYGNKVNLTIAEAIKQSARLIDDMERSQNRLNKKLTALPRLTAMNVSLFDTADGINDSKTIGMMTKIKELATDPKNVFIVYSLNQSSDEIKKILSTKGLTEKDVIVVGIDTFKDSLGTMFFAESPELNILGLPEIIQDIIKLKDIKLELIDFRIIESDPKVVELALDNLATVMDIPKGYSPDDLKAGQEIDTGVDVLKLAELFGSREEWPGDLIIGGVSGTNAFLAKALADIKAQKGADAQVTLDDLRVHIGIEAFNDADLTGIRLQGRKMTVTDSFIDKLKAQRAIDTSA